MQNTAQNLIPGYSNKKPLEFSTEHQASFLDLDLYGHLNSVQYMRYIVDHRFTEIRNKIGWTLKDIATFSVGFYTQKIEIEYLRPILADETFQIKSRVVSVEETTCKVDYEFVKNSEKIACRGVLHLICVDRKSNRPVAWTPEIMEPFFEKECD